MGQMTIAKIYDGLLELSWEITWEEQGAARQFDRWSKCKLMEFRAVKTFYKELVRALPWVPSGDPGDITGALKPLRCPSLHPGSKSINSPKPALEGAFGEFVKFIPLPQNRFSFLKWSLANVYFRTATMENPSPSQTICSTVPLLWNQRLGSFSYTCFPCCSSSSALLGLQPPAMENSLLPSPSQLPLAYLRSVISPLSPLIPKPPCFLQSFCFAYFCSFFGVFLWRVCNYFLFC